PLLQATNCLPIEPSVATHSIIGTGYWMPGSGDSDSVVPVSSARLDRSGTEFYLHAKHTKLTEDDRSIDELFRILEEHLAECGPLAAGVGGAAERVNEPPLRAAFQPSPSPAEKPVQETGWRAARNLIEK